MKKRMQPAALLDPSVFELLAVLKEDERFAFLRHYFWKVPTRITWAHHICSTLMLVALAISAALIEFGLARWLALVVAGIGAAVIVGTPLHEVIHALAYKALGARDIRWTLSIRNQIAAVTAHQFVLARRDIMIVAGLPWVLITVLLSLASAGLPSLRPFFLTALFVHHFASRGDWAYLSYFWRTRGREVYAFEDADAGQCWFYVSRPKDELDASAVDVDSCRTEQ